MRHAYLAEIAWMLVLRAQSPDEQRGMVVAPPPDWKPNGDTLRILMEALDVGRSVPAAGVESPDG